MKILVKKNSQKLCKSFIFLKLEKLLKNFSGLENKSF